jgi:NRPS condensation-like uncharacterized protein
MLRKLGIFEKAMLIANRHAPFNIVSVLRMEAAPTPGVVKRALSLLQERHPLLQARIIDNNNRPFFETIPPTNFPFTVIERTSSEQWRQVAEKEMAFAHDAAAGPLFRVVYLYQDGYGDLVLNVHHAIMDAVSGLNLLEELLRLSSGDVSHLPALEPAPALDERFPLSYQGLRRVFSTMRYALSQMTDMLRYQWKNRGKRLPSIPVGGEVHTATLILPEELVTSLAWRGRKEGLTLNSMLNSALVLGTNRHLYEGKPVTMRTFTFVDLRPFTQPPTSPENLDNYISMMGQTIDVKGDQDFWGLAKSLHAKIYHSLKSGDKFSASLMSEMLLNLITRYKFMRFGAIALSYSGVVPLAKLYGHIEVVGLHGFVSGFNLGPEMASQARLFNDQIWWDFIYLDTDMDAEMAEKIIGEVKAILEDAARKSR